MKGKVSVDKGECQGKKKLYGTSRTVKEQIFKMNSNPSISELI